MFTLTSELPNSFEYKGVTYDIDLSFDNILLMFELFEDEMFLDVEKVDIALKMLIDESLEFESFEEQYELFKDLMKKFLEIDLDEQSENEQKIFDFKQDAELIYASFFSAYNIDLMEQRGKLPWHKFMKLLRQLEDNTQFKKAISYRLMKIPKETKYNKDQVKELKRLKQAYALKDDQINNKVNQDSKLDAAFSALAQSGKKKGVM